MLATIEPRQFDEWMAEYLIETGADEKPSLMDSLEIFKQQAGA
jgi:hypothetical protein